MSCFSEIIDILLKECKPINIVEVGAEYAGSTKILANYAKNNHAFLYVVDPSPKGDIENILKEFKGSYQFLKKRSIEALPEINADIFFLDGDHNYWTVYQELESIYSNNSKAWTVMHDVGFPCARRDMYYNPSDIPKDEINTFSYEHGVNLETGATQYRSGFWGDGNYAIALENGGPRNGTLTAIEDFMRKNTHLHYESIPLIFGLGIVTPKSHQDFIHNLLHPYQSDLCHKLEKNRLDLYNEVLRLNQFIPRTKIRRWLNRVLDYIGA